MEFTLLPDMLLAVQYTRFPLSDLEALIENTDEVLTKSFDVNSNWLAMFVDDLFHVMLAGG